MHWLLGQFFVRPPWPTESYAGKTIIITGSNQGLGKEAARHYARLKASRIILAVRNLDKGYEAKYDIEHSVGCEEDVLEVWPLDMASYSSVRAFATRVSSELDRIDIFLANAGLAPAKHAVAENNEVLITVNTISTLLLVGLLVPKIKATAARSDTRPVVSITSSVAHTFTKFPEKNAPEGQIIAQLNHRAASDDAIATREDLYSVSKLLPIIAVRCIADRCTAGQSPFTLNLVDPGLCWSGLARDFSGGLGTWIFMSILARSTELGSRTLVHGGAQGPNSHGCYLSGCQIAQPSSVITGPGGKALQERVWAELSKIFESIEPKITSSKYFGGSET